MNSYVCGFLMSYDMDKVVLIKKNRPDWQKGKWNGVGGKIKTFLVQSAYPILNKIDISDIKLGQLIPIPENTNISDYAQIKETPHATMTREFLEETGHLVEERRWHCFYVGEFFHKSAKPPEETRVRVYFFAAFGDDYQKVKTITDEEIKVHDTLDFIWDNDFIYNIRPLLGLIRAEVRNATFYLLDPLEVNSSWKPK